jgi:hypothetical protein
MTIAATAGVPRRATASESVSYHFSSAFDSGNGELVSATPDTLTVAMRAEPFTEADGRAHIQWFHFRVVGRGGPSVARRRRQRRRRELPRGMARVRGVRVHGQEDLAAGSVHRHTTSNEG